MRPAVLLTIYGGLVALGLAWALPRMDTPLDRHSVAMDLIADGRGDEAVHLMDDHIWRGIAEYRSNRFRRATAELIQDESVMSLYNLGTAYARLAEWAAARAAYERVLDLDPGHEDAAHNLALVLQAEARQQEEQEEQRQSRTLGAEKGETGPGDQDEDTEDGETTTDDARPSDQAAPTEQQASRAGEIASAGRTGNEAASPDAAAGRADQTAPGDIEATGRFGSGGVRILTESTQQIDLLLGAIRDDPKRVLAARLQAMHRQREGTAQ